MRTNKVLTHSKKVVKSGLITEPKILNCQTIPKISIAYIVFD